MILLQAALMKTNIKCYVDSVPPYRDICKLEFRLEYQQDNMKIVWEWSLDKLLEGLIRKKRRINGEWRLSTNV